METLIMPLLLVGLLAYFIPMYIAAKRHHHNQMAIAVLNIFLGWTFIGWVVALIWATTVQPQNDAQGPTTEPQPADQPFDAHTQRPAMDQSQGDRHIVPRGLAERMKVEGFPQDTQYTWGTYLDDDGLVIYELVDTGFFSGWAGPLNASVVAAAPTVGEMGEWMPTDSFTRKLKDGSGWVAYLDFGDRREFVARGTSEADARAEALLKLSRLADGNPQRVIPSKLKAT